MGRTNFSGSAAITAGTTHTRAGATQLTSDINRVDTANAGDGVALPFGEAGSRISVINNTANTIQVYTYNGSSDTINGIAGATGVSQPPYSEYIFECANASTSAVPGQWFSRGAAAQQAAYTTNNTVLGSGNLLTTAQVTGGAATVDLALTGMTGAANAYLPTVANLVKALPAPTIGMSYKLRVLNASTTSTYTATVAHNSGDGWTLSGTMTIAYETWRDFVVTLTSLTAATLQATGATGPVA